MRLVKGTGQRDWSKGLVQRTNLVKMNWSKRGSIRRTGRRDWSKGICREGPFSCCQRGVCCTGRLSMRSDPHARSINRDPSRLVRLE